MQSIIISRLIEARYQVFLPIGGSDSEILLRDSGGKILRCKAQTASIDGDHSSILKVARIRGAFDILAAFDPVTKNVWVIPIEILEDRVAIRLGKRYDDYLIPEPRSKEYQERKRMKREYLEELQAEARGEGITLNHKENYHGSQ